MLRRPDPLLPIILPNAVTLLLAFPLLIMRLKYGRGDAQKGTNQS